MTLALKAFEKFEKETAEYPYNYMRALEDTLTNLDKLQPSDHLKERWEVYGGEKFISRQWKRDMLIVDHLVQVKGLPFDVANDMWCDWEDYEHEMKGGK